MWPLTDTALHLMDAANLASARRHGVELDLERLWRDADPAAPQTLDKCLAALLAHPWPWPHDPVVIALCYQAEEMRDAVQARKLNAARAPLAPTGVWPCKVP